MISEEDFFGKSRMLHDHIFAEDWRSRMFTDKSWQVIKFNSGLCLDVDDFAKLQAVCDEWGDLEAIVTDIELLPPHQYTARVPIQLEAFDKASRTPLGHVETHVFGMSGKWGMICTMDDISYLAVQSIASTGSDERHP